MPYCFDLIFGVWFGLGLGGGLLFAKKSIRRASGLYITISGKGENKIGCALRSFVLCIWIREWKAHNGCLYPFWVGDIGGFFSLRLG